MTQNPKKMKGKNKTNFILKLSEVNRINTTFGIGANSNANFKSGL